MLRVCGVGAVKAPAPGVYPGVPFLDYLAWDAASQSILREFARSPLHARHALTSPRKDTKALIFGEAVHYAILEPEKFATRYAEPPAVDLRTNAGKAAYAAWQEEHPNAVPLTADEYKRCLDASAAAREHAIAGPILRSPVPGLREVSVVWNDPETGVLCKARPDLVTSYDGWTVVPDVKTTRDASPGAFSASIARYGYHVQAAHYLAGLDAHAPRARRWLWIAVESEPPHGVAVYECSEAARLQGGSERGVYLRAYAKARETDVWRGYPDVIQELDLPRWAQKAPEEWEDAA